MSPCILTFSHANSMIGKTNISTTTGQNIMETESAIRRWKYQKILNCIDMMLFNFLQPPFWVQCKIAFFLYTNSLHIRMNCNHVDDPWTLSLTQSSVQLLNYTCKTCKNKEHLITLSANGQMLYSISVQLSNDNYYGQKLLILLLS